MFLQSFNTHPITTPPPHPDHNVDLSPRLQMVSGSDAGLEFEACTRELTAVDFWRTLKKKKKKKPVSFTQQSNLGHAQNSQACKRSSSTNPWMLTIHSCLSTTEPERTRSQSDKRKKTQGALKCTDSSNSSRTYLRDGSNSLRSRLQSQFQPSKSTRVIYNLIVYVAFIV